MAKIGQLFLNNGTWNGRQVIPGEWVVDSTRSFVKDDGQPPDNDYHYGYQWWIDDGDEVHENVWGGHFAGYHAMGYDGHYIFVLPELDIVVALTACISGVSMIDNDIIPSVVTYELTFTSSPVSGITVIIDGVPQATPYTDMFFEGYHVFEMPATHDDYVWSHWFEDGDTNRTKTIAPNANVTLTGVFFHIADLNQDGDVDMKDIAVGAKAFGSYPIHPRWNPIVDIDKNDIINMRDIASIAMNFGKTYIQQIT